MPLDEVRLSFDANAQLGLQALLFVIMFGVALALKVDDFRNVARHPWRALLGAAVQIFGLSALTFLVASALAPTPSMAFGMLVVAACPGGNFSNFLTQWARGDVALSVSLTAISSALAVLTTPFNVLFWGSRHPEIAPLLHALGIDARSFLLQTALMLGLPLALGMTVAACWPGLAARLHRPCHRLALAGLVVFLAAALGGNWRELRNWGPLLMPPVIAHNALAFAAGWVAATLARFPDAPRRALTIELGVQNGGLGLVIVLTQFPTLGGAALVAAAWGFWNVMAGSLLAAFWSRREPLRAQLPPGGGQ